MTFETVDRPRRNGGETRGANDEACPFCFLRSYPVRTLLAALILSCSSALYAADLSEPLILVAKPELRDQVYGSTVLVVKPLGGDQHVGFIVNRPTRVTLGELFPEDGPSQKVVDPVYLGGPLETQVIFALVQASESPGGNAFELMPGLFAAYDTPTVDRIIASQPADARFVAGLVAWRPGELAQEIKQGAWYVLAPEASVALAKPEGLWEELVQRSSLLKNAI
jgi:putative transcriptional regulator